MKGIVFTEFLDMVEDRFSLETLDEIIEGASLESGGAYTSVGNYDHREILRLVTELSNSSGVGASELCQAFGRHLFSRLAEQHQHIMAHSTGSLEFLSGIESHIHAEVRKLYADAELPKFECRQPNPDRLEMLYRSSRPFADLAEGLILGCADYFKETVTVERRDVPVDDGYAARFVITRLQETQS